MTPPVVRKLPADHEGRCPQSVVTVQHFAGSVKAYIEALRARGSVSPFPDRCPHPDCRASGSLIRWGTYERGAVTAEVDRHLRIQRVRCKVRRRTHSLLPDFLHPHRHFVIRLLQHVVSLYLLVGLGRRRLLRRLHGRGPARSTVREWVASFAYGAGCLLLDQLVRYLFAIEPDAALPDCPTCTLRPASFSLSCCIGCRARLCRLACFGRCPCPPPQHSPSSSSSSLPPHLFRQSDRRTSFL